MVALKTYFLLSGRQFERVRAERPDEPVETCVARMHACVVAEAHR